MSELSSTARGGVCDRPREYPPPRREVSGGLLPGWLIAGAAAVAVGYLAWRHFGPDFRRYMKMRAM